MSIRPSVGPVQHPALQRHLTQRAENAQNRIADTITRFAGSSAHNEAGAGPSYESSR